MFTGPNFLLSTTEDSILVSKSVCDLRQAHFWQLDVWAMMYLMPLGFRLIWEWGNVCMCMHFPPNFYTSINHDFLFALFQNLIRNCNAIVLQFCSENSVGDIWSSGGKAEKWRFVEHLQLVLLFLHNQLSEISYIILWRSWHAHYVTKEKEDMMMQVSTKSFHLKYITGNSL